MVANIHKNRFSAKNPLAAGFTIVELMFALIFISFILMFIVLDTIHLSRLYTKGLTVKTINQSGRTIIEAMSRDIESSTALNVLGSSSGVGMLCLDSAVYAWNGIDAPPAAADRNSYDSYPDKPISLVRIADPSKCQDSNVAPLVAGRNTKIPYPYAINAKTGIVSEMLSRQVSVLSMSLNPIAGSNDKLYRLTLSVGSASPEVYSYDGGTRICSPAAMGDYCAMAELSTLVYMPRK